MGGFNTWQSSDSEDDDPGIKDVEIVEVTASKKILDDIGKYDYFSFYLFSSKFFVQTTFNNLTEKRINKNYNKYKKIFNFNFFYFLYLIFIKNWGKFFLILKNVLKYTFSILFKTIFSDVKKINLSLI